MKLKQNLILLTSFFLLAFLFMPAETHAAWAYVQVQIATAEDPSGQTMSLPIGTVLSIRTAGGQVLKSITTTSVVVPGSTISSGLVQLTNSAQYIARLEVPACDGVSTNNHCWFVGDYGESCNQVCASHGGTESANCMEVMGDSPYDCSKFSLFGINCGYCYGYCGVSMDDSYNECANCYDQWYGGCDSSYYSKKNICACNGGGAYTFNFDFTANLQ